MKIYVVGSTSFMNEMVAARDSLVELGHEGWLHSDYDDYVSGAKAEDVSRWQNGERAALKRENDYFRQHYKNILASDAILVITGFKHGVEDYIGGNALIEMGQAYVHDKKIFISGKLTKGLIYDDEIEAMDPICLDGDLSKIKAD